MDGLAFLFGDKKMELTPLSFAQRLAFWLFAAALFSASLPSVGGQENSVSALREKIDQAERERVEICKALGAIYEQIGDTEKAIEIYRKGFQVFPDDTFLCDRLIQLCKAQDRWAELVPVYRSLIDVNPDANKAYFRNLAECHLKAGQNEEAVAAIAELLDEYGNDVADYREAAQLLMTYEQYEAAASICRRGIGGEFGESSQLHCILCRTLAGAGKYDEAILAYKRAIDLCSSERERTVLEKELADLCKEEPIVEQILKEKTESLKVIDQRLAELYWRKALREEENGDYEAAIALYQKISSLVPDSERRKAAETKIQQLGDL